MCLRHHAFYTASSCLRANSINLESEELKLVNIGACLGYVPFSKSESIPVPEKDGFFSTKQAVNPKKE